MLRVMQSLQNLPACSSKKASLPWEQTE
jgi:hypothetical protein